MVWRGDIEKHYENVDKTYAVLDLIDNDQITAKNELREVIRRELQLSCECIIDWLDDSNNENSRKSKRYLESLELGYDICVVLEVRTFIYQLLDKSFSDLINS
ncbi:MAG: hypothetical protein IJH12_01960 [Clostridia bacterium]|nr:hypothetical protein [Clostridia bacterium]